MFKTFDRYVFLVVCSLSIKPLRSVFTCRTATWRLSSAAVLRSGVQGNGWQGGFESDVGRLRLQALGLSMVV